MKKLDLKKFDDAYLQFVKGADATSHRRAITALLERVGLEEMFARCLAEDGVKSFFLLWERAGREEEDLKERRGLKALGVLSKRFYEKRDYRELCELFYNMIFRHTAEFLHLEERADFKKLTDHDLYTKGLLPPEIFLQLFLIETPVKNTNFDWDRNEAIAEQNLACLIVCLGDIYDFFHDQEEGEDEELENETEPRRKVGRNEPCPCGSGKKFKKCCGGF